MKLYKYLTHNTQSTGSLVNHYSWFSKPSYFNDPFDGTLISNDYMRTHFLNSQKVLCLSKENDNLLLWAHYANSHYGYCVEYTDYTDQELELLKKKGVFPMETPNEKLAILRNAVDVEYWNNQQIEEYISSFPSDDIKLIEQWKASKAEGKEEEFLNHMNKSNWIKHELWKYEKEKRIIVEKQNMNYPPGNITAIYFGMLMSSIDKRTIASIVNQKFNGQCSLFTAYRNGNSYELKFRKFDPKIDFEGLGLKYN
ncbi:DUF2971 domain-containing protein [Ancylomarina sp. DW003]|nr:DUF2971 domain-containing protein [Ancylomarina sp. DW003]MDE5423584.1 DUF2971 domain-containing protein [Ancylomarina sp. DW003]